MRRTGDHGSRPGKGGGVEETIEVEVACAEPARQIVKRISLSPGATLREAVEVSGLAADFPLLAREPLDLGVFGRRMDPETAVRPGDRVEVYRPLLADPRESRRSRARRQSTATPGGPGRRRVPPGA